MDKLDSSLRLDEIRTELPSGSWVHIWLVGQLAACLDVGEAEEINNNEGWSGCVSHHSGNCRWVEFGRVVQSLNQRINENQFGGKCHQTGDKQLSRHAPFQVFFGSSRSSINPNHIMTCKTFKQF